MPSVDHKLSLNPDQLAKLEAAKEWGKRNWKPFVAGAAVTGITLLVFRGPRYPYSTIINNVTPAVNNVPDIPHDVVFSAEMLKFLEKNGSAAIQVGTTGKVLDIIDWSHPVTATVPALKAMFE